MQIFFTYFIVSTMLLAGQEALVIFVYSDAGLSCAFFAPLLVGASCMIFHSVYDRHVHG